MTVGSTEKLKLKYQNFGIIRLNGYLISQFSFFFKFLLDYLPFKNFVDKRWFYKSSLFAYIFHYDEACIPVAIQYYSQADKFDLHIDNFDVTPGIEDPNVFLPRPECLTL